MKVAIVGCGIAGATVAWQMAKDGHAVSVFEQAAQCGPVGAGILLQPSGQNVLKQLGLLEEVADRSARINSLHAQHRNGRTLVKLKYQKISTGLTGYGVRRSLLFDLLHKRCLGEGVDIREGHRICDAVMKPDGITLHTEEHGPTGHFDVVVAADGSRSQLRQRFGTTDRVTEYPDAALWTLGPFDGMDDCLLQIAGRCGRLIGMLPIGDGLCSFFWGLKKTEEASIRTGGVDEWKRQVATFYPDAIPVIEPLRSLDSVAFATYRTITMKSLANDRLVFVGDAGHPTSPHLGQGLNLALEDALCLVEQFRTNGDPISAIRTFDRLRRRKTRFYTQLTGMLTPFFQTSNRALQFGRDLALPLMPHLPYVGKQMVLTMAGLKNGWLTTEKQTLAQH